MSEEKLGFEELKRLERRLISAAPSLKQDEREQVISALKHQLDSGGVSSVELKRILRELHEKQTISDSERRRIEELVEEYS